MGRGTNTKKTGELRSSRRAVSEAGTVRVATLHVPQLPSDHDPEITSTPPALLELGDRLVDGGEIGRGGMAVVHRVLDRHIGRHAAMKRPADDLSPETIQRFLREARIVGQLEHPNIVPIYDLVLSPSGAPQHFTMKLVEGETLHERVRRQSIEDRSEDELRDLLSVLLKVCDAVSFAHGRGVLHRDLKPENVMIGSHGQVYVMDWGIAARMHPAGGPPSMPEATPLVDAVDPDDELANVMGTPQYMAPEQAWGRTHEVGAWTDVFALGGVLYFILTGRAPHHAPTGEQAWKLARGAESKPPHEVAPDAVIPAQLSAIAMRALSSDRTKRHQDVQSFRNDIERCLRSGMWFAIKTFDKGSRILSEGDAGDVAYIVTKGTCEAFRGEGAARVVLRTMGPGDVFGEMALLTDGLRSASVEAVDEVTAMVVRRTWLERELGVDSWLGALVRTLAARFQELEGRVSRE